MSFGIEPELTRCLFDGPKRILSTYMAKSARMFAKENLPTFVGHAIKCKNRIIHIKKYSFRPGKVQPIIS
jgi:hypothetical protein